MSAEADADATQAGSPEDTLGGPSTQAGDLGEATQPGEDTQAGDSSTWSGNNEGGPRAPYDSATGQELQPGTAVGSFIVERKLGAGAMGVVWLAHDPELARPVAIKLLASGRDTGQARLLREAQAAARLAHPNVVAIHQAGTWNDQVFVVMEYVPGGTLREWLRSQPRPWSEVLEAFRQAGLGLCAAHAAGLVHRDFKPDNVLMGTDGRARVSDFGLVGVSGADTAGEYATADRSGDGSNFGLGITRTGALLGTPAYMAPEQFEGARVDARADQFAFAVALFEGLYGKRPFAGETTANLIYAITHGQFVDIPTNPVPPNVHRAVLRGLAANPMARHPSVAALLEAIKPPVVGTRSGLLAAAAVASVAVVGGGVTLAIARPWEEPTHKTVAPAGADAPAHDCTIQGAALREVWNDDRRTALHTAFDRVGHDGATHMFEVVARLLDRYGTEWSAMGIDACTAAKIDLTQSAEEYALRSVCLDDRRADVTALIDLLVDAPAELLPGALVATVQLESIAGCADLATLRSRPPHPEAADARAKIATITEASTTARVMLGAGLARKAGEVLEPAVADARALNYAPVLVRVLWLSTKARIEASQPDPEPLLREVVALAGPLRESDIEAAAWTELVRTTTMRQQHEEAHRVLENASPAAHRAGSAYPIARLAYEASNLAYYENKLDEAATKATEAFMLFSTIDPPPVLQLVRTEIMRASIQVSTGNFDIALEHYGQARTRLRSMYGKNSPAEAAIYNGEAMIAAQHANWADAEAKLNKSIALSRAKYGVHPELYGALSMLAQVRGAAGDAPGGLKALEESVEVGREVYGEFSPYLEGPVANLGGIAFNSGRYADAERYYTWVRKIVVTNNGPAASLARYDVQLGVLQQAQGNNEDALAFLRSARAGYESAHGTTLHPDVADAEVWIGNAQTELEDCKEALEHYDAAIVLRNGLRTKADLSLAQIHTGTARCQVLSGELSEAEASLTAATVVLDSLPSALAEQMRPFVAFNRAKLHRAQGRPIKAQVFAAAAHAGFETLGVSYSIFRDQTQAFMDAR